MSEKNVNVEGGVSFFGLLTVLFVGLKLTNYIDWSWWWVTSPIWLPFVSILGLFGAFWGLLSVIQIIIKLVDKLK